ncbi:MAG: hypothetical protein EXS67_03570 [Candidatus Margulisbacteria bacterium]|nr:hypothetical protein [Candidatus Margulisiibacteriota bacterium]
MIKKYTAFLKSCLAKFRKKETPSIPHLSEKDITAAFQKLTPSHREILVQAVSLLNKYNAMRTGPLTEQEAIPIELPSTCAVILGLETNTSYLIPNVILNSQDPEKLTACQLSSIEQPETILKHNGFKTLVLKPETFQGLGFYKPVVAFSAPQKTLGPIQFPSQFFNLN